MATHDSDLLHLVEHIIDQLKEQQHLLLKNKWPRFMALQTDIQSLWRRLEQNLSEIQQLPPDLRKRLKDNIQYVELILSTQKQQVGDQLQTVRTRKPVVRAYRSWGKTHSPRQDLAAL